MLTSLQVRVARKWEEAIRICAFELVSVDGSALPAFSAGSHIDVQVPNGPTRQYSLCNHPGDASSYRIGVLRDERSRGGSKGMHDLKEGDVLTISAPRNHFPLVHEAERSLLIAGGIGITPILCMAERLSQIDAKFDLHYYATSEAHAAFMGHMRSSDFAEAIGYHFDSIEANVRHLKEILSQPAPAAHLYVCGPKGFMDAVLSTAKNSRWGESQIHYEFFSAESTKSDSDGVIRIKLASSGREIDVGKDETIVHALAAAGVEIPVSCEQGVCGTCLTRVLDGRPDHRDMYLSDSEKLANDQFLPCCSRSLTPTLTLDL